METRKLGKLKRKKNGTTDWYSIAPIIYFSSYFLASQVIGAIKYFTYDSNFNAVEKSLIAEIKLKSSLVTKMINYCDNTIGKRYEIVAASVKLVNLIAHQGGNAMKDQRLIYENLKNSEVNEEVLLKATNEFNTRIMIELLKFLSNETKGACEAAIFSGIDNLNDRIKLQKKALVDFKEELEKNRNLLVHLIVGIKSMCVGVKNCFCSKNNSSNCLKDKQS